MLKHLEVGAVISAVFIDGVADTPYAVGTLVLDPERGVRVSVPYVTGEEQFTTTQDWITGETPPSHLSARGVNVRFELFGCHFNGVHDNAGIGMAEGHIGVEDAVLGARDGDHNDPLTMTEVSSEIDGLYEWSRLRSVTSDHTSEGEGMDRVNTLHYTVKTADGLSWKQGDATLSISTTFHSEGGKGIMLNERAVLKSSFEVARPFADHLAEQRKFVAFMSLMFGAPIAFRKHLFRDERFTMRTLDGTVQGYDVVELISRQTIRDFGVVAPKNHAFDYPIVRMPNIDASALTRWSDRFASWERFLLPIIGVYRLRESFVENIAINSAMSLEALGSTLVDYVDGEEKTYRRGKGSQTWVDKVKDPATSESASKACKTVATDIYRGLKPLGLSWGGIAKSEVGLARAIANNYNSIKHPDRGGFPDVLHTKLLSVISSSIVRLNALRLVSDDATLLNGPNANQQFRQVRQMVEDEGIVISEEGEFVARPFPPVEA
ncbi:hypothetical protein D6T64_04570 [Cryobacterium melibiosiphilum]|uniref:ApeA N-terminal domain-containing protein n=1 Tax=Cryobacterium melibiosiphilum TaxID=995039 RepID=A0A3A5MMG2_9MICO|nr:hypothetical protein [Cryobacterium melibiosiphilum]RJT90201.1 hypothetical protein D6T64_04570 [Cryobacterium melibiosiphilum]